MMDLFFIAVKLILKGKPMKSSLPALLVAVIAVTFSTAATTMPADAAAEKGTGAFPMDCTQWKDKARCESLNRDIEACRTKTDDEWRACMHRSVPTAKFTPPKPRDCSKARNKETCEAHSSALGTCKDKTTRAEHRKCMAEQLPGPGKS
jgi:hypothetical protein